MYERQKTVSVPMKTRRYEAVDMAEAVRMIKDDLGSEAVILSSRTITKGSGTFGLFGRKVVEVTAALAESLAPPVRRMATARQAPQSYAATPAMTLAPVMDSLDEVRESLANLVNSQTHSPADASNTKVSDEVREMKSMLSYLIDQSMIEKKEGMARPYLALIRLLEERGIAPEYIETLVDELINREEPDRAPDLATLIRATAARMKGALTFGGQIFAPGPDASGPRVVALCGPTGVGKTTTVAKLAAHLTGNGAKVALFTIDTYRIAAVEQLKIYARLLKVPMEVILQPGDLPRALHLRKNFDVILIDTAGRSQRDMPQIAELGKALGPDKKVETQLVLSASSAPDQMRESIRNFASLDLSALIFTKLDEATSLGPLFNQAAREGLPLSYFTTGQQVPEDIEEANGKRLLSGIFNTKPIIS